MKQLIISFLVIVLFIQCTLNLTEKTMTANELIQQIEKTLRPWHKALNDGYFKAAVSGKSEDYEAVTEMELKITRYLSDEDLYKSLKDVDTTGLDKNTKRQLFLLTNMFLNNQGSQDLREDIIKGKSAIEQVFSTFRAEVDGESLTDNQVDSIISHSTSSQEVETVWKAHKKIGSTVSEQVVELVKKRNVLAEEMGYPNYHAMQLSLSEQNPEEITSIFDELDDLTRETFEYFKSEIDQHLAKKFDISKEDLKPWHYQNKFFQEGVEIYNLDFDALLKDQNLEKLSDTYFKNIGLDVEDVIQRSDLYEKPGKNQHAFCIDIDREGDVRTLCNLRPNHYWNSTLLHELGHAAYSKFHNRDLPYFLRDAAHILTTEAIAMIFGRLSSNPYWYAENTELSRGDADKMKTESIKSLALQQLVFSRWCQVVFRFEKSMYENPDQDLNTLWWKLVEKYQGLKKPKNRDEPDWASKIHIAAYPCYYHNYQLGELMASQLHYYICQNITKESLDTSSLSNNEQIGAYLIEQIFAPGIQDNWNDMIENAMGEKLTPKYYAKQFIVKP